MLELASDAATLAADAPAQRLVGLVHCCLLRHKNPSGQDRSDNIGLAIDRSIECMIELSNNSVVMRRSHLKKTHFLVKIIIVFTQQQY